MESAGVSGPLSLPFVKKLSRKVKTPERRGGRNCLPHPTLIHCCAAGQSNFNFGAVGSQRFP